MHYFFNTFGKATFAHDSGNQQNLDGMLKTGFSRAVLITLLLGFVFYVPAMAQLRNISHQTFEVSDSVQRIQLDIVDSWTTTRWAGDQILLETKIKLLNASPTILEFLLEQGRYEVVPSREGATLFLKSRLPKRPGLTYKGKMTEEGVAMRLFIPDAFVEESEFVFIRKD